jgi:predicted aconitase
VIPTYSCVFYENTNKPSPGDRLAWAESSAVLFANSVLGARANLSSLGIDFCSAITGLTPEFGYLLDEHRRGQVLIKLKIDRMDPGALGFVIGKKVVHRVPVIEHYPFTRTELRTLGAALASSGKVGLFHVEGLTPEAPDLKTIFDGQPEEIIVITQEDLDALRSRRGQNVDIVVLGCPLSTYEEALALCERFAGSRVRRTTWICVSPEALEPLEKTQAAKAARAAGVEMRSWCPLAALGASPFSKRVLAASAKLCYYLKGAEYGTCDDCLSACGVSK